MAGLGGQVTLPGHEYLGGLSHLGSDNNFYYSGMEEANFLIVFSNREKAGQSTKLMVSQSGKRSWYDLSEGDQGTYRNKYLRVSF